jgi:hypothetical protein
VLWLLQMGLNRLEMTIILLIIWLTDSSSCCNHDNSACSTCSCCKVSTQPVSYSTVSNIHSTKFPDSIQTDNTRLWKPPGL